MGRPRSQESSASIVSLDPAIVGAIVHTIDTGGDQGSRSDANSKTERPATDRTKPNVKASPARTRQTPSDSVKGRNNSLRKIRNSTEVLRQRAAKDDKGDDNLPHSREARHFTVGSVGSGGLLYLRPAVKETPKLVHGSSLVFPLTPPKSAPLAREFEENTRSSDENTPWHRPVLHRPATSLTRSATTTSKITGDDLRRSRHGRAYSFSSVDDRVSLSESNPGALRIVINRSTPTRHQALQSFGLPTLEVAIPHYRLGTPRFSTQGTPIIRSSVFNRASAAHSDPNGIASFAQPDRIFPTPPNTKKMATVPLLTSRKDTQAGFRSQSPNFGSRHSSDTYSDSTSQKRSPISPAVFDDLAKVQDDPSVVRYSQKTGDIMAATPARIVAQISSESFMDYELVSDFFLTFRAYMSTMELLDLLMARMRWAIGRLEEDGRIIRIRTFAALRHWILNYFMDDFVINHNLRMRFCEQINELYAEVYGRRDGGISDLKILQDLKRCWNGRCSLYWDLAEYAVDASLDAELIPGGRAGNRDSIVSDGGTLDMEKSANDYETRSAHPNVAKSWFGEPPAQSVVSGSRLHESVSINLVGPESPWSEQSLQPSSCSLPMRTFRGQGAGNPNKLAPQPISVLMRREKAPSNLAVSTGNLRIHKRSARSIDSSREPTPRATHGRTDTMPTLYAGSLIRGQGLAPSSPLVEVLSSLSTSKFPGRIGMSATDMDQHKSTSPISPGVRTIFGSIRRALGGKYGASDVTLVNGNDPRYQGTLRGKILTKSFAATKSHDELRKIVDSRPVRSQTRVDLLCAAILHSYELALSHNHLGNENPDRQHCQEDTPNQAFLRPGYYHQQHREATALTPRMLSQVTAQSGSILIVDDTGLGLRSLSGDLPKSLSSDVDSHLGHGPGEASNLQRPTSPEANLNQPSGYITSQRRSGLFGASRTSSHLAAALRQRGSATQVLKENISAQATGIHAAYVERSGRRDTIATSRTSDTMKKASSFPSTVSEGRQAPSLGAPGSFVESEQADEHEVAEQAQSHTLKRRPGGDLKKTQHVHDLELLARHQSLESAVAATDSTGGSLLIMANRAGNSAGPDPGISEIKQISMIHTHSSQHLRPSFEEAISGFAALPDDGDGGLEATLQKLEGRYEKPSPILSNGPIPQLASNSSSYTVNPDANTRRTQLEAENECVREGFSNAPQGSTARCRPTTRSLSAGHLPRIAPSTAYTKRVQTSNLSYTSNKSYDSAPLLDRGAVEPPTMSITTPPSAHMATTHDYSIDRTSFGCLHTEADSSHSSLLVVRSEAVSNRRKNSTVFPYQEPAPSVGSFLLDEDENFSDLSSEISVDIINQCDLVERPFSPMFAAPGTARSGLELPAHPLAYSSGSPSIIRSPEASIRVSGRGFPQMPPTPDPSPEMAQTNEAWKQTSGGLLPSAIAKLEPFSALSSASLGHIPFILACDSQTLAQQFTLVEQSALSEVEWIDLVDMRWDNRAANILDWVEFLKVHNTKGIDLVITRFNIMVKWALSEIVLTQNINERARTITKYIHVAAHCRRLHNYATMLQITIALTSTDCTRLRKTWELVSAPDRSLLKTMETLIQPLRNFRDLRSEMESADLSDGCIPFVGLYVHDLTYNAQKPSQVAGTRESEPLVNFERYRTAATIVKDLLRLVDASSKYTFQPVEGIADRCLWMAALNDEKIRELSKSLEESN